VKALITVDWDFFVREDPLWDIQHNETGLYINTLWHLRGHLIDAMKTDGNEKGFWKALQKQVDLHDVPVYVSESHSFAFQVILLHRPELVISYDTHHDLWPRAKNDPDVFCHNWLRAYLQTFQHARAIWVYPEHSAGQFRMPEDKIARRCKRRPPENRLPASLQIEAIHICRSGAWTPPWLDEAFGKFVGETERFSKFRYVDEVKDAQGSTLLNPLFPRWTPEDLQAARQFHETTRKHHEQLARFSQAKGEEVQKALGALSPAIAGQEQEQEEDQ
jgi:hypothetical protein